MQNGAQKNVSILLKVRWRILLAESGLKIQSRKKPSQQKSNDKFIDAFPDALKMRNLPKIAQLSRFQ